MIERKVYLDDLISFKDKHVIKVITGVRRCGKSTLLEMFQHCLLDSGIKEAQIISVNLEDGEYRNLRSSQTLYTYIDERLRKNEMNYVCIDEVQQVENFQEAIDWLYTKKNVDMYITGSNAFLLSGELATLLSGRYVEIKMLPLSFKEYVSAFPNPQNTASLYVDYLQNSSFPGSLELARKKDIRLYLEGIYNTILMKDIATRKKITDPLMLTSIVEFMFDNIGNLCSTNKIANTMTSLGRKISIPTVENYLVALVDSFIFYKVNRYDIKGKQRLATGSKYYAVDMGLRYYLLGSKQVDMGHILENIVYLELLRRGNEIYVGKIRDEEVDFITINEEGTAYYQVSLSVLDEKTRERELASLEAIKDHNPKYLLTMDYTPPVSYNGIRQYHVLDWLLK